MLLRIAAALMMLALVSPVEAKKAPKPAQCFDPKDSVEAHGGKLSDDKIGIVLDNAVKFAKGHGAELAENPDALRIAMFPDGSLIVFFLKGGCVSSAAPVPPQGVETVIKAIMGDPA